MTNVMVEIEERLEGLVDGKRRVDVVIIISDIQIISRRIGIVQLRHPTDKIILNSQSQF